MHKVLHGDYTRAKRFARLNKVRNFEMDNSEKTLSRRKALGRIGLFATAAYTVPAFATLSMAHASSGASSASAASEASEASTASGPSDAPADADVTAACGAPDSDGYAACLIDNGWEGYVAP